MSKDTIRRTEEYHKRGDYHKNLNPNWAYYPTYIAKAKLVKAFIDKLPAKAKILDVGCGEGVLVEEDAIIDGETGILVKPKDYKDIAKAVIKLMTDKELAQKLGQNGKQRVETEFNWDIITKRISNVINECAKH